MTYPRNLEATLHRLAHKEGFRFDSLDALAAWFVEDESRLMLLSERSKPAHLAERLDCDIELARLIWRDKELYRAVMEKLVISKANPLRMATIYEKLLSRLETDSDKPDPLRDVVAALDFVEKRLGNHPTLMLKGEIEHSHRMVGVMYAQNVSPTLKAYVEAQEALPSPPDTQEMAAARAWAFAEGSDEPDGLPAEATG